MIKRECFDTTGGYGEAFLNKNYDYILFLKMLLKGYKFYCIQAPLIKVRVSRTQRSRRGGIKRLYQDYLLRKWMVESKIISRLEAVVFMVIYTWFRLQPNTLRDLSYLILRRRFNSKPILR